MTSLSALNLVGMSREDIRLVTDFALRLDKAMATLADREDWPLNAFRAQEVLPGLIRLTSLLREEQEDEFQPHPKYFLDGRARHIKWFAILAEMYPGGVHEKTFVRENVQGHPDYVVESDLGRFIVEIKTVGSVRWKQVTRKPLAFHVEQVRGYLTLTGCSYGYLVYENRDDLNIWVYVVRPEEAP